MLLKCTCIAKANQLYESYQGTLQPLEPSCFTNDGKSDAGNDAEESVPEPSKDTETQTEQFAYMFHKPVYKAPDREYFSSDDKVRFYTPFNSSFKLGDVSSLVSSDFNVFNIRYNVVLGIFALGCNR